MIGQHPERFEFFPVGPDRLLGQARPRDDAVEERPELTGLVDALDAVEDRQRALQPHAGVDVLARQFGDLVAMPFV